MFCTSLFVILTFCFWAFYCLSFLRSLIAPFVLRFTVSICPFRPSIYGLYLPLSSFDLRSLIAPFILRFTGLWLPLSSFDLRYLIAPFVLRFIVSDCAFRPSIYGLWLPLSSFNLRYLIAPFILRFTGLWLSLSSFDLRYLIAPFVLRFTVSDCRFRPSIYTLWLPLSSFDLQSLIAPFVLRFTVLILIYDRSVVFSCFSGFIHQKNWPPRWGSRCSIFLVVVFCRSLFLLLHCLPPITPFVSSIFFVHMYSRIGHAFATRSFNIIILVSAMVY